MTTTDVGPEAVLPGFVPIPGEDAARYRDLGMWEGRTLAEVFDATAARFPDDIACIAAGEQLTYRELQDRSLRVARGLQELGIEARDRIVVQLPNVIDFVDLCLACFRVGAIPVMALPPHRDHEIQHLISLSDAIAYAIPAEHRGYDYQDLAERMAARAPSLHHVLVAGDSIRPGFVSMASLRKQPPQDTSSGVSADDVAVLLLSGGTTGLPKLIPRTHDDYAYNARVSAEICRLDRETVYMATLPVSHNFPLACPGLLGTFLVGGRTVIASGTEPETAFALIQEHGVTCTALVPALAIRWMDSPSRAGYDLSSLRLLQVGGARLNPEAARRVTPTLGCTLQQVFGMAEGLLNFTRFDDPEDVIIDTQGRPASAQDEIRVVDDSDRDVPPGEPGHLLARGPYTIRGYFRAEEHNARAFTRDGFYRTGDVVRIHPSGNLVVEGREKDLINRGGEKISAEEIENLLLAHPAIFNAAAVSMPDPVLGERICTYVVLRDGCSLTLEELCEFVATRDVARFKYPERLEVVETLPVTNVGKIDKKALREDIAARMAAAQKDNQ
ncbi:MAG: (2,3-dihydroxybenzoyl)adenylate synthase [Candidatus Dormibacteraeota bacterium]|nr:(2,3-dihydroxybenzoyl)adenylate synthase [Candidatus Dormibacteraeota bacterium]MBV9525044.1 (2,3-dihydroxybenzoyl)adenylate synthase [Candidatus Dormibacteraeota bacterium]